MNPLFDRRPRLLVTLAGLAVVAVLGGPPAVAHEGHGSCGDEASTFHQTHAGPEAGPAYGEFVKGLAQDDGAGEDAAALHEACEPTP